MPPVSDPYPGPAAAKTWLRLTGEASTLMMIRTGATMRVVSIRMDWNVSVATMLTKPPNVA